MVFRRTVDDENDHRLAFMLGKIAGRFLWPFWWAFAFFTVAGWMGLI